MTTDTIAGVCRPDRLPQRRQPETLKFAQCRVTVALVLRHRLQQRASQNLAHGDVLDNPPAGARLLLAQHVVTYLDDLWLAEHVLTYLDDLNTW